MHGFKVHLIGFVVHVDMREFIPAIMPLIFQIKHINTQTHHLHYMFFFFYFSIYQLIENKSVIENYSNFLKSRLFKLKIFFFHILFNVSKKS